MKYMIYDICIYMISTIYMHIYDIYAQLLQLGKHVAGKARPRKQVVCLESW